MKYVPLIFAVVITIIVTIVLVLMNNAKAAAEQAAIAGASENQKSVSEQFADYWNALGSNTDCKQYQYVPDNLRPAKCRSKSDVSINSNMILGMFG